MWNMLVKKDGFQGSEHTPVTSFESPCLGHSFIHKPHIEGCWSKWHGSFGTGKDGIISEKPPFKISNILDNNIWNKILNSKDVMSTIVVIARWCHYVQTPQTLKVNVSLNITLTKWQSYSQIQEQDKYEGRLHASKLWIHLLSVKVFLNLFVNLICPLLSFLFSSLDYLTTLQRNIHSRLPFLLSAPINDDKLRPGYLLTMKVAQTILLTRIHAFTNCMFQICAAGLDHCSSYLLFGSVPYIYSDRPSWT